MNARMFPRGTTASIPLEFVRIQPYVSPKIQLSNQRTERVDLRVLPVLFKFTPLKNLHLYPGMLVDVYLEASGGQKTQAGEEGKGNEEQRAIGKSKKKKSS